MSGFSPVCTCRRPVWWAPPSKMWFDLRRPKITCKDVIFPRPTSEWGFTLTFCNLWSKSAEVVSHDLSQNPHPCAFKQISFHKMIEYNTSVAFGQATSWGFLGSVPLSSGQKPLSPFLAPRWTNLKIQWRDSLPCKLHTIQMVHFQWKNNRFCCCSSHRWE